MAKEIEVGYYIGKKYNKLEVIEFSHIEKKQNCKIKHYVFKCDCGNVVTKNITSVTSGNTKSCGCIRGYEVVKTGISGERVYNIWKTMKSRCFDKTDKDYFNYGGKGITVCDEWLSALKFKEWAFNNGYKDNLSIDRIDNDGNYEPGNCRWVDIYEQNRNRRCVYKITIWNETKTLIEWCDQLGLNANSVNKRITSYKYSWNKALELPDDVKITVAERSLNGKVTKAIT